MVALIIRSERLASVLIWCGLFSWSCMANSQLKIEKLLSYAGASVCIERSRCHGVFAGIAFWLAVAWHNITISLVFSFEATSTTRHTRIERRVRQGCYKMSKICVSKLSNRSISSGVSRTDFRSRKATRGVRLKLLKQRSKLKGMYPSPHWIMACVWKAWKCEPRLFGRSLGEPDRVAKCSFGKTS